MVDEEGRNVSVNGEWYLSMLRDRVWPEVRGRARRNGFWWQQDGATSHVTNQVLDFLSAKFGGRIISRRSNIPWPPDLNVLDHFFWSFAMAQVRRVKPSDIDELKATVEEVARSIPVEMVRDAARNLRKRCRACEDASGGHFESFLKSM